MGARISDASRFKELSPGVRVMLGDAVHLSPEDFDALADEAVRTGRCSRILLHDGVDCPLQEMLIAHPRGLLFLPHRSNQAIRSYHLLRGRMALVLFDDDGTVAQSLRMTAEVDGGPCMFRFSGHRYHAVIVQTDVAVFVETAPGPFAGTEYPDWAPKEGSAEAETYRRELLAVIGE